MITFPGLSPRFGTLSAGNPADYEALLDNVHPAIESGGTNNPYLAPRAIGLWVSTREDLPAVIEALKKVEGFEESPENILTNLGSAYKYSYKGRPVAFLVDSNKPVDLS